MVEAFSSVLMEVVCLHQASWRDFLKLTGADEMKVGNVRNWLECIRSRKPTNAQIDASYSHSVALCMTIAAMQSVQRITFNDTKQQVVVGGHS